MKYRIVKLLNGNFQSEVLIGSVYKLIAIHKKTRTITYLSYVNSNLRLLIQYEYEFENWEESKNACSLFNESVNKCDYGRVLTYLSIDNKK